MEMHNQAILIYNNIIFYHQFFKLIYFSIFIFLERKLFKFIINNRMYNIILFYIYKKEFSLNLD